jgi:hypothetical protein
MCNVSKEIKSAIIEEMAEELGERDYYYEKEHLWTIVNECCKQKKNLIDLLSKHPLWNPEKLMIQFDTDIERKICTDEVYNFVEWLRTQINGYWVYWVSYDNQPKEYKICEFIKSIHSQFFDEDMKNLIDEVNSLNENFKLRTNMKASKAIGKICREEGWDKLEGFNQKYAKLCDCLSPLKIRRHTVISLNPIDFLLMSNGNSWNSCHYIGTSDDAGCYSSGTISYMLDEYSFLFYTVDASYDGNQIEREPKIQRQVFGYSDETIIQLRLYPQDNDYGAKTVYEDIRAIVQKVIADCLDKPNLWIKSSKDVEQVAVKGIGATCYPDWRKSNPGGEHCTMSIHKERQNEKALPQFVFGAKPICIFCGDRHSCDENISCCDGEDNYRYCTECGERIYIDDVYWVEGRYEDHPYCENCVTYCEDCNEYRPNDEMQEVDGYWVCDHCVENGDYFACESCGELHYVDNMYYDEETEEYYCDDCYDKLIAEREEESEQEDEEVAI